MNRRIRTLVLAAVGTAALAIPTAALAATPVADGCPASSELMTVAYLESVGDYSVPGALDDAANGGNGDGWICAFPLPAAVGTAWGAPGFQVYMFFENNLPARERA